jgi:hypothetical protein
MKRLGKPNYPEGTFVIGCCLERPDRDLTLRAMLRS